MKTLKKLSILFCLFFVKEATCQITQYPINNNTGCAVDITYTFYDNVCGLISNATTNVPVTGVILTAPTGAFDIEITVNFVSTPACPVTQANTANSANNCSPPSSSTLAASAVCCPINSISVTTSQATIN